MLAAGPISRTKGVLNWCGVVCMSHTIDPSVAMRCRFSSSGTDTTVHRITVLVVRTASGRRLVLRGFLIRRDVDDADRCTNTTDQRGSDGCRLVATDVAGVMREQLVRPSRRA